ncbi:hypothetical protein AGLY_015595 [Aphis glycines]|uniref:DRBM domain-containing protein n=1 Tax=Aphis glycines TaxID=307491 RepID=A0A6G0T0M1_APHGL|nr:hypothetical protein AGLY_015595 [Aphis glycines]
MLNCFYVLSAKNELIYFNEVESINKKTDVKWPPKSKINKKEQKKRRNARVRRLVLPKSPLVVFSELFNDVPIHLFEHQLHNVKRYTATFEFDGQTYSENDISKIQAKQKACEKCLRIMLANKLNEQYEKKEESLMDVEENGSISKPKGSPQDDFPWGHFASLAMYKLINQWKL